MIENRSTRRLRNHIRRGSLVLAIMSGSFSISQADLSSRRQVIVFALPTSESGAQVRASVAALRCELVDRDTDVRFVDIRELVEADKLSANKTKSGSHSVAELSRLRGEGRTEFEMLLIGKDGGVKARSTDPDSLQRFLVLIDSMPMRRAELQARARSAGPCE